MLAMLVGLAAIVWFASRSDAAFTATEQPGMAVRFQAQVGDGLEAKAAKVDWDLNGDGTYDEINTPEVTRTYAAAGKVDVVMRVTNAFGHETTVKRSINVGGGQP
jgi:PKD repeat protein